MASATLPRSGHDDGVPIGSFNAVYVMSAVGTVLGQFTIEHAAEGIATLTGRVAEHGDPTDVQVGTERPKGRLVDLLWERGRPVVPASPNAIKTWRDSKVHRSHQSHRSRLCRSPAGKPPIE